MKHTRLSTMSSKIDATGKAGGAGAAGGAGCAGGTCGAGCAGGAGGAGCGADVHLSKRGRRRRNRKAAKKKRQREERAERAKATAMAAEAADAYNNPPKLFCAQKGDGGTTCDGRIVNGCCEKCNMPYCRRCHYAVRSGKACQVCGDVAVVEQCDRCGRCTTTAFDVPYFTFEAPYFTSEGIQDWCDGVSHVDLCSECSDRMVY